MKTYRVLVHEKTLGKVKDYLGELKAGKRPGNYLRKRLPDGDVSQVVTEEFLELLVRTKLPQIFAESAVVGDGSDWNQQELSLLGDVNIAVPVTVYDNARHTNPQVHRRPFPATLLFTPGALLRNGRGHTPADWNEATRNEEIDAGAYYQLYERRLLPLFLFADKAMRNEDKTAFITVPGLGCGQFAGKFRGRLGAELKATLMTFLENHGDRFSNIKAVYYDPYSECDNERCSIAGVDFFVRPLAQGNEGQSQLCQPRDYEEAGDDFSHCELFSVVAWDHVSWPGNDFYAGSRATDDGVKAAATNTMAVLTEVEGHYNAEVNQYQPPTEYRNWGEVIVNNSIAIEVKNNLLVFS